MARERGKEEEDIAQRQEVEGEPLLDISVTRNGFAITCGPGWLPLIGDVSQKVWEIVDRDGLQSFHFLHAIEKFGALRIYSANCTEEIAALILKAEIDSKTVCEGCSKPSKIRNRNGWYTTRCNDCADAK